MATKSSTKTASKPSRPPSRPSSRPKPASRSKPRLRTAGASKPSSPSTRPSTKDGGIKAGAASDAKKEDKPRGLPDLGWGAETQNLQTASNTTPSKNEEGPKLPTEAIPGPPRRPQIGEHDRNRARDILRDYDAKYDAWKGKYGDDYSAIQDELKKLPPRPQAPQYDIYNRRQSDAERAQHERELQAWQAKYGERYKELNSLIK